MKDHFSQRKDVFHELFQKSEEKMPNKHIHAYMFAFAYIFVYNSEKELIEVHISDQKLYHHF